MKDIRIERTNCPKAHPDPAHLGFGRYFTDHMFLMDYSAEEGWQDARIVPFGSLSLHPASTVLHYGTEIFEGLKAYRRADGRVQLFRPEENARRLNNSARRLCLPTIPEEDFLHILDTFVGTEKDWTPDLPGTSLYLRPFLYGADETLGVHAVSRATFCVIASPVGSYYKNGLEPVGILIEDGDVRAVRGGTGEAKCGGNYAASNRAAARAEEKGYSQVLWLDGVHRRYIEEVGAMNIMFRIGDHVVTPALTGSILPGITRKSCIELLREEGYTVEERLLDVDELVRAMEEGTLKEAFGTGTAAVVSPVGHLAYRGKEYTVGDGGIGSLTRHLYDTLTGIQWGTLPDTHGWTHIIG